MSGYLHLQIQPQGVSQSLPVAAPAIPLRDIMTAPGPFHHEGLTVLIFEGEADEVQLRTWMPRFPASIPFERVPGTHRWFLSLRLPATARIEYGLRIRSGPTWHEVGDRLNPPTASNPFGTNSVVTGPAHETHQLPPAQHPGTVVEIRVNSRELGGRRHHHVYLPHGFSDRRTAAILFVHDGHDFIRFGGLIEALDSLIEMGFMTPAVVVALDPWKRLEEYTASTEHGIHVFSEVIAHLQRRLGLVGPPESRGLLGASLGAVAALSVSQQFPGQFGRLGLISGSFVDQPTAGWPAVDWPAADWEQSLFGRVFRLVADLGAQDHPYRSQVYISCGRYEGLIDYHRRMVPLLRAAGHEVKAVEAWEGHDWGSWRDRLVEALCYMYPGPESYPASP